MRLGYLRYGVRFSKRFGIDEDNDQSTITNTAIYNVTDAAISIEHSQSQGHHFYGVKATGARGTRARHLFGPRAAVSLRWAGFTASLAGRSTILVWSSAPS